jgi:hypothetical protein
MSVLKLNQIQTASGVIMANLNSSGANAGIQLASNLAPAFSAYKSGSNQTVATSTWTKITFETEDFDTNNNYTSSRFTPTVAGYYQVNWLMNMGSGSGSYEWVSAVYKNGVAHKTGLDANSSQFGIGGSILIYLNGTDNIEIYTIHTAGSNKDIMAYQTGTFFQAYLARSA